MTCPVNNSPHSRTIQRLIFFPLDKQRTALQRVFTLYAFPKNGKNKILKKLILILKKNRKYAIIPFVMSS